jgi:transposase
MMLNEVCDAPEEIVDAGQAKDQRRRSRLEAECLAEFKPTADLSTYRKGKSVRTTRATAHHEVHPNQVTTWKTQALENMAGIFCGALVADDGKEQIRQLREKIGELTMERDFCPMRSGNFPA